METDLQYVVLFIVVALWNVGHTNGQLVCNVKDSCTCEMSDGSGEVNLHSIDAGGGSAKFVDLFAPDNWYYSYNPCSGFNRGSCSGAAACQSRLDQSESYLIGSADTAEFNHDGKNVYIAYTGPGDGSGNIRITTVTLLCDANSDDAFLTANGESLPLLYSFTLTTKCACPGVCAGNVGPSGTSEDVGISAGSVLCIIFFVLLFIYLAGGVTFNRVKRNATGKDLLPNVEFWTLIPGLIKVDSAYCHQKDFTVDLSFTLVDSENLLGWFFLYI